MKIKIKAKHILGLLVATIAFLFISSEMTLLISYFVAKKKDVSSPVSQNFVYAGNIISILIFVLILFLFIKYAKNGLGNYLLLSVVVSIVTVGVVVYFSGKFFLVYVSQQKIEIFMAREGAEYIPIILGFIYIWILIGIFVLVFQIMVKRKIKYLEYITTEVKNMEKTGFGKELAVKSDDELALLSQSISGMSVTLKEKSDEERRQNEEKMQLIADISHDLRTPLTSVIGYSDLIRENALADPEKCKEYIEVVSRRLADLNTMVDQLFEYTKLNQIDYRITKAPVDVNGLLHYIDSEYSRIYRNNRLRWKLIVEDKKITANIDSEKFIRAMENLLSNARKYAAKDSEVVMQVKEQENQIYISLSNEVESPESLDETKLFDRFYKSDEARTETSGTGLGLPIVRKIVELHGGHIRVQKAGNRIGFLVVLPK